MSLIEIENQQIRRDLLNLLEQDADYQVSEVMLNSGLRMLGNPISHDRLRSFYDANALNRIQQAADVTKSSGTHTIDLSQPYGYQKITASGNFTLAFSNVPSGVVTQFIIEAVNWGAYTVTLPTYKKEFGTTLTFTSSGTDIVYGLYDSAGALTLSIAQQNIS